TTALVDSLVFDGNTRLAPNNNISGVTVQQITFNATAGAFDLKGIGITLNSGIVQNSAQEERVSMTLTLGGSQTWDALGGALFVSDVDLGAATLTISGGQLV